MALLGYARVSTDGQKVAGAVKVFSETASGAKTDRQQLAVAI
jgi:hypothetical protein